MRSGNRSWFRLLAFCLTTTSVAGLAVALLLATAALAVATGRSNQASDETVSAPALQPTAATTVLSGVITDSYCGARHSKNSGKTSEECTRQCVRNGAKYVLVNGENSYALAGNESELERVAGQRAELRGMLDGDTLRVISVATGQ